MPKRESHMLKLGRIYEICQVAGRTEVSHYDVILEVSQPGTETSNDSYALLLRDHDDDIVSDVARRARSNNNRNDVIVTFRQRVSP